MSLFSGVGGGRATIFGGRVIIFSLLSGGGSQIFSRFIRGGSKFFSSSFFIEKITYEHPAAAGAGFRSLLILPLPSKKKCPEDRIKTIYMSLDARYGILKEGQTDRRILLFYCYV